VKTKFPTTRSIARPLCDSWTSYFHEWYTHNINARYCYQCCQRRFVPSDAYADRRLCCGRCLSVCLSHAGILSKRL